MKYEITDDFIGIFDDVFDTPLCENYIEFYERQAEAGLTFGRGPNWDTHTIKDESTTAMWSGYNIARRGPEHEWSQPDINMGYLGVDFLQVFWRDIYPIYLEHYSVLKGADAHTILDLKLQKTVPSEGYHLWHYETSTMMYRNRILVVSLYLNDVEEGGETEFLYLSKRIKPVRNRLLIWPAGFTHSHRGNQPLSGDKYLLTGWVEFGIRDLDLEL